MSHSADAEDFIVAQWRDALLDAGVDEADYHLITCPGAAVTGHPKAASFPKGAVLVGDEGGGIVVRPDKLAEANSPNNRDRHRVAVYEDVDDDDPVELAYLAGVLRHEIEHSKQRDVAPEALDLSALIDAVAEAAADGDYEVFREIVNRSPIEADANGVAGAFLKKRAPDVVPHLLAGADHYLVDSTSPGSDPASLVERTTEYLWQFRSICDDATRHQPGETFADVLDDYLPGSGDRWRALRSGAQLSNP